MLTHQTTLQRSKSFPKTFCRLTAVAAIAGFAAAASMSSHAASGGEIQEIELPSMRTPIEAVQAPGIAPAATVAVTTAVQGEPLTRARFRESLAMARLANLVTPGGEMGDTAAVLQAREDFNALQTEVTLAEYRTAALQLQQAQMDALVAQAEGDGLWAGAAETPLDPTAAAEPAVEVVVVSSDKVYDMLLEAGHAANVTMGKEPTDAETRDAEAPVTVLLLVNESVRN